MERKQNQGGVSENNTGNETSSGLSQAKKFKLGSKTRDDSNEVIPDEDFEIQTEWEGKRSISHIRILLSKTRRGRN